MKSRSVLLPMIFLQLSCGIDTVEQKTGAGISTKHLVVVVYDISASVDKVAVLTPMHLEVLYDSLGSHGGGQVYGLHIKTNSRKQEPVVASVSELERLPMKGNSYQRANRRRMNEELQSRFENGKTAFVTSFERLMLPKVERFSDVGNALELAKQVSAMSIYRTWTKHILIISDLENDLPPVDGMDKMTPILFDRDIAMAIVRPSRRVELVQILPGVKCSVYSTINDAIQAMFSQ